MKKAIFLAVFSMLVFISFAQNPANYEDVVYLKNGSIYRGLIIEQVPNVSLKIQSSDRNVFGVQLTEIEKITKEEKPNDFYRNGYFQDRRFDQPNFDTERPRREYKPTKLSGFYMNWGIGGGGNPDNSGFILEMNLGGKIFPKGKEKAPKKVVIGGDIFGSIGGVFGMGASGLFGVYGGPTIGIKLHKGNVWLTPYTGLAVNAGSSSEWESYYDNNGNYISASWNSYEFVDVSIPMGFKFEYGYKRFICGANSNVGFDMMSGVAGKFMGFVGVKF